MAKSRIVVKIPEILKERGLTWEDLAYNAGLSQPTARNWSNPEKAKDINGITFDTMLSIAEYLELGIEDMFEIIEE